MNTELNKFLEEEQEKRKKLSKNNKTSCLSNKTLVRELDECLSQQKEFINYLQKEINQYTAHIEAINNAGVSIYSPDYDNSKLKLAIYKEILLKYIEIVNGTERN